METKQDRTTDGDDAGRPRVDGTLPLGAGAGRRDRDPSPEAIEIAQYLYDAIRSHSPDFGTKPKVTAQHLTGWAKMVDVGLRNDGFELADYKRAIDHAHKDSRAWVGWKANIRSGKSLRAKCDQLLAQATAKASKAPGDGAGYTSDGVRLDEIDYGGAW